MSAAGETAHAWHGRTFKDTLARAMAEAYGITVRPPNCRHGVYADALERRRLRRASSSS